VIPPEWIGHEFRVLVADITGVICANRSASSGFADAQEEFDGFCRFLSASLHVITLAISVSMVRRECGRRPGIVASEEQGTGVACLIVGHDSGSWFACRTFL
jgi:hypothetical protein